MLKSQVPVPAITEAKNGGKPGAAAGHGRCRQGAQPAPAPRAEDRGPHVNRIGGVAMSFLSRIMVAEEQGAFLRRRL